MSQPERPLRHRELAMPRDGPFSVYRGSSSVPTTPFITPATTYMSSPNIPNMHAKWKGKLCDSWSKLGKFGQRGFPGPRVAVRSVLVQEARTSGPRVGEQGTTKTTSPRGLPCKP
jgi:hypothetical protein